MILRPLTRELAFHWPWLLAAWLYAAAVSPASGQPFGLNSLSYPEQSQCYIDAYGNQICPQADAQGWHVVQERGWPRPEVVLLDDGGTGAIIDIDGTYHVLTCAHKDSAGRTAFSVGDRMGFKFNSGEHAESTVVQVAPIPVDACIMRVDTQLDRSEVKSLRVASEFARQNEPVTVLGFPMGSWRERRTQVDGYTDQGLSMQIRGPSTPGESGGPILNSRGEVVGVLSRTGGGVTWCCPQPRIVAMRNRCGAVVITPSQPQPTQPKPDPGTVTTSEQLKQDWLAYIKVEVSNQVKAQGGQCQCPEADYATKADLQTLAAEVDVLASNTAKLSQSVESIADANASITNTINNLPDPYQPPTDEELAEKIAPHLKHSATITLLDGSKKVQTKPLNVPLDVIQRLVEVK